MFNLPQSPIPIADTGIVGYRMIDLSTGLNSENFTQNTHTFRFTVDGNTYWIPQRSYIRIRAQFKKKVNNVEKQIGRGDAVAPAYGFCSTLFQSLQHDMSGSTVSSITSYVPQIDALRYRTGKSDAWRKTMGPLTNAYGDFVTRQNLILRRSINEEDAKVIRYSKASFIQTPGTTTMRNAADTGNLTSNWTANEAKFTVTETTRHSWTADDVLLSGNSGTYAVNAGIEAGTAVSLITVSKSSGGAPEYTWKGFKDRVDIGDYINVYYRQDLENGQTDLKIWAIDGSGAITGNAEARIARLPQGTMSVPQHSLRSRVKIVGFYDDDKSLVVWPYLPPLVTATTNFNFEIEHVHEKYDSVPATEVEFLWSPPLSMWQDIPHGIPASIHELRLTPSQEWQKNCMETTQDIPETIKYDTVIKEMKLFISVVDGPLAGTSDGKGQYVLNVSDWVCNAQQASATDSQSLRLATYDVHASTTQLAFALQNTSTSNSYKNPVSRLIGDRVKRNDLKLKRFFVQYAGQQRPTPDSDSTLEIKEDPKEDKNWFTQRWYETLINTNAMYNPGGVESMQNWLSLGPYYYFNWPKPPTDISTRVSFNYTLDNKDEVLNILLFSKSNTAHLISLSNGRVVGVETQNIFGMVTPSMVAPIGPQTSGGPLAMSGGRVHYRY
jgi:hypothetical protein